MINFIGTVAFYLCTLGFYMAGVFALVNELKYHKVWVTIWTIFVSVAITLNA